MSTFDHNNDFISFSISKMQRVRVPASLWPDLYAERTDLEGELHQFSLAELREMPRSPEVFDATPHVEATSDGGIDWQVRPIKNCGDLEDELSVSRLSWLPSELTRRLALREWMQQATARIRVTVVIRTARGVPAALTIGTVAGRDVMDEERVGHLFEKCVEHPTDRQIASARDMAAEPEQIDAATMWLAHEVSSGRLGEIARAVVDRTAADRDRPGQFFSDPREFLSRAGIVGSRDLVS